MTAESWKDWACVVLRRCYEAENKIRRDFGLDDSLGLQDTARIDGLSDDELRSEIERWTIGNICARRMALIEHDRAESISAPIFGPNSTLGSAIRDDEADKIAAALRLIAKGRDEETPSPHQNSWNQAAALIELRCYRQRGPQHRRRQGVDEE